LEEDSRDFHVVRFYGSLHLCKTLAERELFCFRLLRSKLKFYAKKKKIEKNAALQYECFNLIVWKNEKRMDKNIVE